MNIPRKLAPLAMAKEHNAHRKAILRFLDHIWAKYDDGTYTFLAARRGREWVEHPIKSGRKRAINTFLEAHDPDVWDIYFCPNAFRRSRRKAEFGLPTHYAWCDIDDTNPAAFKPAPNVLWETSEARFQGLWFWKDIVPAGKAEAISKNLLKFGGDTGGHSITKMMRVPGTINHKPDRNGERVRLLRFNTRSRAVPEAISDPYGPKAKVEVTGGIEPFKHDPVVVMRRYRPKMGMSAGTFMTAKRVIYGDRSRAVACVIAKLVELGADNDEIASAMRVNVYFTDKWGDDLDELERQIIKIRSDVEAGR